MGSAMRISNASTDPKLKWDLPKPNLRPGAEDFLKLQSRHGQELRPYRPGKVAAGPQGGDNLSVQSAFNFGTVCDAGTECKS